nr:MAG TPA: hypothetical protein [Caudoviricetes sp.]
MTPIPIVPGPFEQYRLCPTAVLGSPLQRIAPFLTEVDCVVILHFI